MNVHQAMRNVDEKTVKLFNEHRTLLRRSYVNAHIAILGGNNWSNHDSEHFDALDAMLFNMLQSSGHMIDRTANATGNGTAGRPKPIDGETKDKLERNMQSALETTGKET